MRSNPREEVLDVNVDFLSFLTLKVFQSHLRLKPCDPERGSESGRIDRHSGNPTCNQRCVPLHHRCSRFLSSSRELTSKVFMRNMSSSRAEMKRYAAYSLQMRCGHMTSGFCKTHLRCGLEFLTRFDAYKFCWLFKGLLG